jgi:transposase-like protein
LVVRVHAYEERCVLVGSSGRIDLEFDGAANGGGSSPEVPERPTRRTFTAEHKVRIVEEAEACTEPGEIGALMRREGLWSASLSRWRRQYREGALKSLSERKRGPRAPAGGAVAQENKELKRRVTRLERKLERAEKLLEIQNKSPRSWGSPGGCRRERERMMAAVDAVADQVGVRPACEALGVPRASGYRR